jgi:LysM repeat protein
MKFKRSGRHATPSQAEKVAEKAGKAAPVMAISAGALMAAPHGHHATPVTHATVAEHTVATKAAHAATARLDSAVRPAQASHNYTVKSGDTLSTIASAAYGQARDWQWLFHENNTKVRNPNLIYPGQVLSVPANPPANYTLPASELPAAPAPAAPAAAAPAASTSSSEGDGASQQAAPAQAAPVQAAPVQAAAAATTYSGTYPGGAFGQCVVARESGGNAQVMNSSGHYGLYQFSASTWAAYGGSPGSFGNASVAQQNQVFANALAQGGQSNWSPYDGC